MDGVRRATPSDMGQLIELVRAFYRIDRHPYEEIVVRAGLGPLLDDDKYGQVWVLPAAGDLVGYAVVCWSWSLESGGRDAILDEIYVGQRQLGLGTELLNHAIKCAAEAGASRMYLETEEHNDRVRRFYARNGFVGDDSIWMSTDLAPAR